MAADQPANRTPLPELPKTFKPADIEPAVLQRWNGANAFHAEPGDPGQPYAIVIPPPNVTAALHLGHALNNTLQDILIRWRRMCGDNAMWMPGTDHAGIATQTVVDKRLQSEGKPALKEHKRMEATGQDGRGKFVAQVQAWKDEYEATITNQLKTMGCSCDWARQRFTMDDMCARAVREAFFQLFKDGLIYRGKRLVNWDPATQTALADDEVEMQEIDGHFWYLKYPVVDDEGRDSGQFVVVATTRPETMLGDTAVAMNPADPRAAALVGGRVRLPIINRIIPIIADEYVVLPDESSDDAKAKFASGFLKVTPAHDPNDYEIGQRHNLPIINVMAPDATISKDHGWPADDFARADPDAVPLGLDRYEAREAIVEWFRNNDLLAEARPYRHSVGHSYRSHVPVEPYLSDQWYVAVTKQNPHLPDLGQWRDTDVPLNSLAGLALQAMAHDAGSPTTSRDRKGVDSESPADERTATRTPYLITFTTYGTWLHGDDRGSVDRSHNLPGSAVLHGDPQRERREFESLRHEPFSLDQASRQAVQAAIAEVAANRGWPMLALHVRPTHVHVVVAADTPPERVMIDFKAYATRRLRDNALVGPDTSVWTRHGSTRYLNEEASIPAACRYVTDEQGTPLEPAPLRTADPLAELQKAPIRAATVRERSGTNATNDEERSLTVAARGDDSWRGRLRFIPERYAKTFQTWHENIRDWCISRQLWWGHRIPVWHKRIVLAESNWVDELSGKAGLDDVISGNWNTACITIRRVSDGSVVDPKQELMPVVPSTEGEYDIYICAKTDDDGKHFERYGYTRDPDVLDTWFSSGLWPLSTMGWPAVEGNDVLATWNPTNVLSTAREIITLWVSRMVMFNLYFHGRLPFRDVFIHAMIQDGDGRKMSKSLGNGVDPLDIIHSHGSDAMRFTLAQMTTQTQDVRMPVERDAATGRNTSPKFDNGRNFANKLWNAVRFALGNLEGCLTEQTEEQPSLADRWILSRLARTLSQVNAALEGYQFNVYAQSLYDFAWRDLCDWYLEAIKPVVRDKSPQGAAARQTLGVCLDALLRMLHPVMPFLTEALWEHLNRVCPQRSTSGVELDPSDLCIKAPWPKVAAGLINDEIEQQFELVRQVVGAMREVRTTYKVPPRQTVPASAKAPSKVAAQLLEHCALCATLANIEPREVGPKVEKPADAASTVVGEIELYLHGLIDADEERKRLTKRLAEVEQSIRTLAGRLGNASYVSKAPEHLVQQTREQLAAAEKEKAAIEQQITAVG